MAKTIAVWGSPASGKTTFAVKLACRIHEDYQASVLVILADNMTPALPVLFPNRKKEELFSVGALLSLTEITKEDTVKQIVTVKDRQNLGFLGYKDGENRYTYPDYSESKVRSLLDSCTGLADYVIIDCTGPLSDRLSGFAVKNADEVIRLASPDLKSISWQSSQILLFADPVYRLDRQIVGLNVPENELYMPIEDAKAHLSSLNFTVPHCRAVRQQMLDGKLTEKVSDRAFNAKFKAIAEKVV